jgi:hypothetical protein
LPVGYFHVVFTLPESVAAIAFYNKDVVYDILFRVTAETLLTIVAIPNIWAWKSASSRCSIAGGRTCIFILTCTA